mgnify:CR=1 FL=1
MDVLSNEKYLFPILAIVVLVIFYVIYFAKMLVQRRHGIQTRQIGRRKEKNIHTVELLMNLEDQIGIEIELDQKVETVGDLDKLIQSKKG